MVSEQLAALEPVLRAALIAFAVLIGVLLAVSLRRVARSRRDGGGEEGSAAARRTGAGDAVPRVLEARGIASADTVRDMSDREQLFLFEHSTTALGARGTLRPDRATPAAPAAAQAPHAVPPATLRCPLCTASLATGGTAAYFLGGCPGCGRRISARMDGARLVLTVDDAAR